MTETGKNGVVARVGCYLRVSTPEQKRKHNPIAAQRQVCLDTCNARFGEGGYQAEFYVDEGLSGTLGPREEGDSGKHRPEFTRLTEAVREGRLDYVCCQDLDRLGRDEADAFNFGKLLAEREVPILTPNRAYALRDPHDAMAYGMQHVFSAFQPRQTGVKSAEGKKQRARRGLPKSGRGLYGWSLQDVRDAPDPSQRKLVPVAEQGRWVRKMAELYLRGWGYRKIAAYLGKHGAPPPGRSGWYGFVVKSQLCNCKHAGLLRVAEDEYARGLHYPDRHIEPETFHAVQREMARRAPMPAIHRSGCHFLTGTLRCGSCGSMMRSASHSQARHYQCGGAGWRETERECPNETRKADHVETVVLDMVRQFALSPRVQRLVSQELDQVLTKEDAALQEQAAAKAREVEKLQEETKWLISKAARNPELRREFDEQAEAQKERSAAAQEEYEQLHERVGDVEAARQRARRVHEIVTDFDRIWQSLEDDERKHVIHLLFDELTLSPAEAGSTLRLRLFLDKPKDVFIPAVKRRRRPKYGLDALTLRQCSALCLTDQGYSTTEIAERWGTQTGNVNVHLMKARCKLRVDSTQAAIELSREHVKKLLPFLPLDGPQTKPPTPEDLTETERKLLPDIADRDLVYREIAETHAISENTVKVHAANIARKLRARGRAELIAQVKRLGLLDDAKDVNNEDR